MIEDAKYAELICKVGINLQQGQCVRISTPIENINFAKVLLEKCYQMGAKFVTIEVFSDHFTKNRITYSNDKYLDYLPQYIEFQNNLMAKEKWSLISITNTVEFDTLKDCPPEKIQKLVSIAQKARKKLRDSTMNDKQSWVVCAYPTEKWSNKIYKEDNGKHFEEFCRIFNDILKLNSNTVEEWLKFGKILKERVKILNDYNFDSITLRNKNGEINIGLNKNSIWHGGSATLPDGQFFYPNLPTMEVFTTPDYRKTSGKIKVVRPVEVFGNTINELELEFKDGKVVWFDAKEGKDIMQKYLTIDQGSSFLGEIALVDNDNPITKSNLFFNCILFDENASSHIALGGGYPSCIKGGDKLDSDKKKLKAGCNVSIVHTDFMIGTDDTEVIGIKNNEKITIMKNGNFVI